MVQSLGSTTRPQASFGASVAPPLAHEQQIIFPLCFNISVPTTAGELSFAEGEALGWIAGVGSFLGVFLSLRSTGRLLSRLAQLLASCLSASRSRSAGGSYDKAEKAPEIHEHLSPAALQTAPQDAACPRTSRQRVLSIDSERHAGCR